MKMRITASNITDLSYEKNSVKSNRVVENDNIAEEDGFLYWKHLQVEQLEISV